jgi:hypothetical protein
MAQVITAALDQWLHNHSPTLVPRLPSGPDKSNQHLHELIKDAFAHQTSIGWGHFLLGHFSLHWKQCIAEYYKFRQPRDSYNLNLWMTKTVDAIWDYFLLIWTDRNGELYGKDYDEQRVIALETTQAKVEQTYEGSKHYVNNAESAVLHARPLEQI